MAEILISPGISISETDVSAYAPRPAAVGAALIGPAAKGQVGVPVYLTSYADYVRRFGTTFSSGSKLYEFNTSIAAKHYFDQGGEALLFTRVASGSYSAASTSVTMGSGSFTLVTFAEGSVMNSSGESGSADNITWEVVSGSSTGMSTLVLLRGDSTEKEKIVLERFSDLSFDPLSDRYVEKVIGNQHVVVSSSASIVREGEYVNKSALVYVSGVTASASVSASTATGSFSGGTGNPSKTDYSASISSVTKILENKDEYQFNVVFAPGMCSQSKLVSLAESRGDCIAVVDVDVDDETDIDSSYAAAYCPELQVRNSLGQLCWVPASTVIPGVYAASDRQSAPWYAPAGMVRGGIPGVTQAKEKLSKARRDELYSKNINPIASFPGSGIVIYGQKTLQKKATALDRVNVRRLLIEVKNAVKNMAANLLFEQNTQVLRNSFRSKLEPYLESLVQRSGIYGYKVVLDELNDADTIDRNEFRCQVILQPSKVIEYVYLDFTVTSTGVEF